ncbi:MAG: nucleotide exchange factor GrpE [Actinobacteria bacterium]|nr:nucleotide exchange factor GrpE [Actinomycetota bacterium]NBY15465.1 nucleotide exchange factor GrpE [Actinomycetota bacterium]
MSESEEGVKITDKRKLDPETGELRVSGAQAPDTSATEDLESGTATISDPIAELTADLQRVQAEFVNYRKRVERDRLIEREAAIAKVLTELLPVLDDIGRARSHGELEGGFKSVGEALEATVARLGLTSFGQPGDEFDPMRHEAITHEHSAEVVKPTCVSVFQPGYEFAGRIIRAAIVSVADPE